MRHEILMCLPADGLECVAAGGSVHAVLDALLVGVMELFDNAVAAVMLRPNSAHPMALVATQLVPIACVGALRTAVNQRAELVSDTHAQVIADVQDEPRWPAYRQPFSMADLRACWSAPIRGAKN